MNDAQRLTVLKSARAELRLTKIGYNPSGGHWHEANELLDKLAADLAAKPKWLSVGAVTKPGASLLDMRLTHNSDGIALYPAVDLAWGVGVSMYAPEACVVFLKDTSASPGEALYLKGVSGLQYWFAHLDRDYALGHSFAKGAFLAKTVYQAAGKGHGHVGVNAEVFLGKGRQLKYGRSGTGPDYTTGSPTIRAQLQASEL